MEGAAIAMAFAAARSEKLGFGFFGLQEGEFGSDGDKGIEFGVKLDNAREQKAEEFNGREFSFAEEASDFFDGGEGEIGVGHGRHGNEREWGI